ncbi:molybdopterin/thiamine biosynthesis adenylyltransferase [Phenylobacterium koreense]|uniref:Molybdopterin/thiamine biosynthesis adenylyltransferase n=2 Tax=Caulobacteraceae TaxID=76892 RepID=A0ABV2EIW3_9CAUL
MALDVARGADKVKRGATRQAPDAPGMDGQSMSFTDDEVERYARHLVLREVGGQGQQRLKAASALIVGAGGLGAPASLYLAAAGIGRIVLADADVVDTSNLQRQVIFRSDDVGRRKVEAAADQLRALNPHVHVDCAPVHVEPCNVGPLVAGVDLVLDGTDDFATRFAVNEACVRHERTLVSGAIGRWTGQVGVFRGRPCYRCLVPEIPPEAETCVAVGVVGALAGVIGSMMALEAIKLIAGAGDPLAGRLMIYDGLSGESRTVRIGADPECPVCGSHG